MRALVAGRLSSCSSRSSAWRSAPSRIPLDEVVRSLTHDDAAQVLGYWKLDTTPDW